MTHDMPRLWRGLTRARTSLSPPAGCWRETANALGGTSVRKQATGLLNQIEADPGFTVVRQSDDFYERGLILYSERPDKNWSLTDCISFVVMEAHGITEALTGDRHFEQAGFRPVFV
jgi:predicted nucleic acid-binding protein